MRRLLSLLAALPLSCALPHLVPVGTTRGRSHASAVMAGRGVTLVATAESRSFDADVTDVSTPIDLFLLDDKGPPLAVAYGDFSLRDESGRVYQALPPAELLRAVYGSADRPAAAPLAGGGSGVEGTAPPPAPSPTPPARPPPPPLVVPSPPVEPHVVPGPGPFAGPGAYWGPWFEPAWAWGPWGYWGGWYWPGRPPYRLGARQVVSLALRPGTLPEGGRMEGFVFFQAAWAAQLLTLEYRARPEGAEPFTLTARFEVRH